MYDSKTLLVSTLSKILPTHYELFCDSSTAIPCITYTESNNYSRAEGDTLRFSTVAFTIKVWDDDIGHASQIACQVDDEMKKLGLRRTSSNELTIDNNIVKIMVYEGLALEEFNPEGD